MSRTIAIANQKGGVGKTTTTVNLCACLAKQGKKVLLIDSDPQGNSTSGLGIDKTAINYCLYDCYINDIPAESVIIDTEIENLKLLPSTIELAGAEIELVSLMMREGKLKKTLESIKYKFDFLIIDCPPSLGLLTINALTAANSVLIPIQCEFYALEGVAQLMKTVTLVQRNLNPALTLEGILLTMFDGRTNLSIQVVDEVKKHFKHKVYNTIIPRNVRLSEAPSHGQPITLYDPLSKGALAYTELAQEVIGNE